MRNTRLLSFFAIIVVVMLIISCGNKSGGTSSGEDASIKNTALTFINAMKKNDLQNAKNFVTDSSKALLDGMAYEQKNMTPDEKQMFDQKVAEGDKYTVTLKEVNATGNNAIVSFTVSDDPSGVDSVSLVKENGKWLVDCRKL